MRNNAFISEIRWNFENYKTCGKSDGSVYTLYKSLELIDEGRTRGHRKKLVIFNVIILSEKVSLVK